MATYQIYTNRSDGLGWVLDGCWGSDEAITDTEDEARQHCEELAEMYPDTSWGYTESGVENPQNIDMRVVYDVRTGDDN